MYFDRGLRESYREIDGPLFGLLLFSGLGRLMTKERPSDFSLFFFTHREDYYLCSSGFKCLCCFLLNYPRVPTSCDARERRQKGLVF